MTANLNGSTMKRRSLADDEPAARRQPSRTSKVHFQPDCGLSLNAPHQVHFFYLS